MPLNVEATGLPSVLIFRTTTFRDDRGYFRELGRRSEFDELGLPAFVQTNESLSSRGVVRGLHYQVPPTPQGKLVRAAHGTVWDVAVDLRSDSATFLDWFGLELDAEAGTMLWIPEGFGHGFVALSDTAVVNYRVTAPYDAETERSIRYDDPTIGIDWPLPDEHVTVNQRDADAPFIGDAEVFPSG